MKENHWRLLCDRCCHGEQGCVSWGDAEPVLAGEQTGKHGEMAPAVLLALQWVPWSGTQKSQ